MALSNNVVQVGNSFFFLRMKQNRSKVESFWCCRRQTRLNFGQTRKRDDIKDQATVSLEKPRWGKEKNDYQNKNRWLLESLFTFKSFFTVSSILPPYKQPIGNIDQCCQQQHDTTRKDTVYLEDKAVKMKNLFEILKISPMNIIHRKHWKS